MKFKVWLINFGYDVFASDSLDECMAAAVKTGFECAVFNEDNEVVKFWTPIGGWR